MGLRTCLRGVRARILGALLRSRRRRHARSCCLCAGHGQPCVPPLDKPLPRLPPLRAGPAPSGTAVGCPLSGWQPGWQRTPQDLDLGDDGHDGSRPAAHLLAALDAALGSVRWAASGHLAVWLYCRGQAHDVFAGGRLTGLTAEPSIVCPRATRDVLPSWCAAAAGGLAFDARRPDWLRVDVDGAPVTVRIEWVDDDAFGRHPYAVQADAGHGHARPPVLAVPSLAQRAAAAYARSARADERRVLGAHAAVCLLLLRGAGGGLLDACLPHESPALYDARFYEPFCREFGDAAAAALHGITACPPGFVSVPSSAGRRCTIPRKPLPRRVLGKPLPALPDEAAGSEGR